MERIDWDLFRSINLQENTRILGVNAWNADTTPIDFTVRNSYLLQLSRMASFPRQVDVSKDHILKVILDLNEKEIESESKPDEDLERSIIDSAHKGAELIEQKLGEEYVFKITETIMDWYGDAKMLPNALRYFSTAATVVGALPDSEARLFLDNYSPLCFDDGFMESLASDFQVISEEFPQFITPFLDLFVSMSKNVLNESNLPTRIFRRKSEHSFAESTTLSPEPPDPNSYLLATFNRSAQVLWDSTTHLVSSMLRNQATDLPKKVFALAHKYGHSFEAASSILYTIGTYIDLKKLYLFEINSRELPKDKWFEINGSAYKYIFRYVFGENPIPEVSEDDFDKYAQPILRTFVKEIYKPEENLGQIFQFFEDLETEDYSRALIHTYGSSSHLFKSMDEKIFELIRSDSTRHLPERILVTAIKPPFNYQSGRVFAKTVIEYYNETEDIDMSLRLVDIASDSEFVAKMDGVDDAIRPYIFMYAARKILGNEDYDRMFNLLNSIPKKVSEKMAPRLPDEELVFQLSEIFKEEIDNVDNDQIYRKLSMILDSIPQNILDAIQLEAGKQDFQALGREAYEEHLDFFYCRYQLLSHNLERYLPVLGKDLTHLELMLREDFRERYGFNSPSAGTVEERLEQTLQFYYQFSFPNIDVVFKHNEKYGSLKEAFKHLPETMETIELLLQNGYDTEFYVASSALIAKSSHEEGEFIDWLTVFKSLIPKVIGYGPNSLPEISIPNNSSNSLYGALGKEYELAREGDKNSAIAVIDKLREFVSEALTKQRSMSLENFMNELNGLNSQIESDTIIQGGRLTARMWDRSLPYSLYHNQQLASCTFLPNGGQEAEAPRMVFDPQVSMVEYFVNGDEQISSVAIYFAGKDEKLLMDTWTSNQSIYSILGNRKTKEFVLDTMVLATLRSLPYAENPSLLIYESDYGRSQELATFLRQFMRNEGSISYDKEVPFESVSVDNVALSNFSGDKLHFSDAFTKDNNSYHPIKGKVKAFVIDVKKYVQNRNLVENYELDSIELIPMVPMTLPIQA